MPHRTAPNKKLLLVSPSSLDTLNEFKVDRMLLHTDELGYFEKVIRCHPLTPHRRKVVLSPTHEVLEFCTPAIVRPGVARILRLAGLAHYYLHLALAMARLARSERITIVRATDPYLCGLVGLIAARLSRRPFCVSIHSDYDLCYESAGAQGAPILVGSRRVAKMLERFVLSHADLVLPIRDHLMPRVIANGARTDRVRVIPHGIDLAPFLSPPDPSLRARLGIPDNTAILSFVGRLSDENLVDDLLELARLLAVLRSDFALVMAGSGSKLEHFRAIQAADPLLKRHLFLTGPLPIKDVAALRKASTLSLCPMGGFSLIEACAASSAVIAYDIDWHKELVREGETGFLCPKGDINTVVQRACTLLDTPDLAISMGQKARALAIARHGMEASARQKIVAYEALLATRDA